MFGREGRLRVHTQPGDKLRFLFLLLHHPVLPFEEGLAQEASADSVLLFPPPDGPKQRPQETREGNR